MQFVCDFENKLYLKDNEFAFKNSQEMPWLFSHDHPDLDRGTIVLVVDVNCLIGTCCDLIFSCMAALVTTIKLFNFMVAKIDMSAFIHFSPATCRGCAVVGSTSDRCKAPSSSLLHRTGRTCFDRPQPALISQFAISNTNVKQFINTLKTLDSNEPLYLPSHHLKHRPPCAAVLPVQDAHGAASHQTSPGPP